MKKPFSNRFVASSIVVLLSGLLVIHALVLTGIIPMDIIWGGRLRTDSEMYRYEAFAVALNLLMIFVVATKAGFLVIPIKSWILDGLLWAMFGLFVMNTIGNLLSPNEIERVFFAPLTVLLSALTWRLARQVRDEL